MKNRNITLAYFLSFFGHCWFWLGIWVFYYLRFTDYAGIGILETVFILTSTVADIPTGAIADLLGKKLTLFSAFLLQGIGMIMMGLTPNAFFLGCSIFVASVGGALYSGTLDALVYDSLKEQGNVNRYEKTIATIKSLSLIAPALAGAVGGFLYVMSPGLPFFFAAAAHGSALVLSLFLREPSVDTEKFSFNSFLHQTRQGFRELTKSADIKTHTILLLSIGVIVVIVDEMLSSFLGVEFGFTASEIGIFWAVIYLVSAAFSQTTPFFRKIFGRRYALVFTGGIIALTLVLSPAAGFALGAFTILVRSSFQTVFNNLTSVSINEHTESKYRATTLSTFNTIKNIPYVLTAYLAGSLAQTISAKYTALVLGMLLLVFLLIQMLTGKKSIKIAS